MAVSDEVNLFARWLKAHRREYVSSRVIHRAGQLFWNVNFGDEQRFFFDEDCRPLRGRVWWR